MTSPGSVTSRALSLSATDCDELQVIFDELSVESASVTAAAREIARVTGEYEFAVSAMLGQRAAQLEFRATTETLDQEFPDRSGQVRHRTRALLALQSAGLARTEGQTATALAARDNQLLEQIDATPSHDVGSAGAQRHVEDVATARVCRAQLLRVTRVLVQQRAVFAALGANRNRTLTAEQFTQLCDEADRAVAPLMAGLDENLPLRRVLAAEIALERSRRSHHTGSREAMAAPERPTARETPSANSPDVPTARKAPPRRAR